MPNGNPRREGFTLVEILIVLVILGILAAVVVPRYSSASAESREVATKEQLRQMRTMIELYKTQHDGKLPDLVSGWGVMTKITTYKGKNVGPYVSAVPVNPLNNLSNVVNGDPTKAATGSKVAYIYDYAAGNGTGRVAATDADGLSLFKE
jgi:general secretion pathway protein G